MNAEDESNISMWNYHGDDNQLWFWDNNTIHSKKYPDKVLEIDQDQNEIKLAKFIGGSNQMWKKDDDGSFISEYEDFSFDIQANDNGIIENGAKLKGKFIPDNQRDKWSEYSKEQKESSIDRKYFTFSTANQTKVLHASNETELVMWDYHGGENQLWFWDDDVIRSKMYPDKVLELKESVLFEDEWGNVQLNSYSGKDTQRWTQEGDDFICHFENVKLDVREEIITNGAEVVAHKKEQNHKWSLIESGGK